MSTTLLKKARNVTRPSREAMLHRDPSVNRFWNDNEQTFEAAWTEWENDNGHAGITLDSSLYAPELRHAIEQAWEDPAKETNVKDLWTNGTEMMKDSAFRTCFTIMGLAYAILLCFNLSGPFLIQEVLGHSPEYFGNF